MGRPAARHARDHRAGSEVRPRARLASTSTCSKLRSPTRTSLCIIIDPEDYQYDYDRSAKVLPREPKEIKPHPYGVELGRLATMMEDSQPMTISEFLRTNFSRVTPAVAKKVCQTAKVSTRSNVRKVGRKEVDALYQAIQGTKISNPATDCICPIGEELILKGLHEVVPGEFYTAATRPPAVYRGNPFQIEVGLAYGGTAPTQNVSKELLNRTTSKRPTPARFANS